MRAVLVAVFSAILAVSSVAQAPQIEGAWYGTIRPGGTPVAVAINFQKQGSGWAGILMIEGGDAIPLDGVVAAGNAISFAITPPGQSPQAKVGFKVVFNQKSNELNGEFTLSAGTKSSFTLSRSRLSNRPRPDETAIDSNELLAMMESSSGPLNERPFVPPVTHPAIEYGIRPPRDVVANLIRDIESNKIELRFAGEDGYLKSLLEALNVPIESQMAVFSQTSVQGARIGPSNPRKLYFNDSVSVGSVGGGFIELAAQDPEQGINFYILPQQPADRPLLLKRDECLQCHLSRNSLDIPGMLVRSVYPRSSGAPMPQLGSHLLDHRTPFENRWGGWFVTGGAAGIKHLGNAAFTDAGESQSVAARYDSDIIALMVFEHQMHMMNLIIRAGWDFRMASWLEKTIGKRNESVDRQLRDDVNEFVDYLLFVDEAPLPNKIQGTSTFADKFSAAGPSDSKGRSLRQFDLEHRLMRYGCSYMIYSPAFDAMPGEAKKMIYARMGEVMGARFSASDRQAVIEILRETKKDMPL